MWRWQREIYLVTALLLLALTLSFFIGHLTAVLLVISVFLLVWQTLRVDELERWLSRGAFGDLSSRKGIWGDIYYHLYKIKKTDKKRKRKLSRVIEQFRQSTDALPDAAVVLSRYGEIEWTNKAARHILGLKKSDRSQRIANLVRNPLFLQYFKAQDYRQKISIPSPVNENIILQISIVPYGEDLRLMVAQDITHLKNMERMRTDFVANVSHELRTPLTVLKGYLETLQEMDDISPVYARSLQNMMGQTERMQFLIDDLLLLTRLETKGRKMDCVDMTALLQQICRESDFLDKDKCRIELTLASNANVKGDAQELRSAVTNLLVNALKYSPEDRPVKVIWRSTLHGPACLEVLDFGEGIAASDIPRITERFFRAEVKRNRKINGTGLGLSIVKHVLVRHDAKLEIESQLGQGSQFRCVFPAVRLC